MAHTWGDAPAPDRPLNRRLRHAGTLDLAVCARCWLIIDGAVLGKVIVWRPDGTHGAYTLCGDCSALVDDLIGAGHD